MHPTFVFVEDYSYKQESIIRYGLLLYVEFVGTLRCRFPIYSLLHAEGDRLYSNISQSNNFLTEGALITVREK